MDIFDELEGLEATREYACVRLALQISCRLGEILDSKGWTMSRLAKEMGVTRSYIQQVLSARQNVTLKKLAEICFALDVDPLSLFGDSSERSTTVDPTREVTLHKFESLYGQSNAPMVSRMSTADWLPKEPSNRIEPPPKSLLKNCYGVPARVDAA